jgi:hypothetical protein
MEQNSKKIEQIAENLEMTFCHLNDDIQRQIAWAYLKKLLDRDPLGVGWLLKKASALIDEAKDKLDKKKIIP